MELLCPGGKANHNLVGSEGVGGGGGGGGGLPNFCYMSVHDF